MDPANFADRLVGRRITALARRAKYLLFSLDSDDVLLVHLRMTGRLLLRPKGAAADPYTRVVIGLDCADELRFADVRKFGRLLLLGRAEAEEKLASLGPEPLGEEFSAADMARALGKRKAPVKSLLLDQTLLAGLGNIYADEALFLGGIHPRRRADTLSAEDWQRLHRAVRRVLAEGIAHRGTSFRDYRDGRGEKGSHQESLNAYHRTGQPCPRCGRPIERIVVGGRSSHFCPACQS